MAKLRSPVSLNWFPFGVLFVLFVNIPVVYGFEMSISSSPSSIISQSYTSISSLLNPFNKDRYGSWNNAFTSYVKVWTLSNSPFADSYAKVESSGARFELIRCCNLKKPEDIRDYVSTKYRNLTTEDQERVYKVLWGLAKTDNAFHMNMANPDTPPEIIEIYAYERERLLKQGLNLELKLNEAYFIQEIEQGMARKQSLIEFSKVFTERDSQDFENLHNRYLNNTPPTSGDKDQLMAIVSRNLSSMDELELYANHQRDNKVSLEAREKEQLNNFWSYLERIGGTTVINNMEATQ